ncbi:hypothetical protein STEG23_017607 [Scotinomys teguina]
MIIVLGTSDTVIVCDEELVLVFSSDTYSSSLSHTMRRINRLYGVVDIQSTFFSEVGLGISFNSILLLFHLLEFLLEHRPQTTDLLISLLALIHLGMLTVMGLTAADIFASQNTWDDITCQSLVHLHRSHGTLQWVHADLYRHKKQSQHLHSTSLSPKASPEERATRTILLLVSFFVVMYCLDYIISASRLMHSSDPIRHSVQMMVSNSYATVSPLLLICTENRITNFLKSLVGGIGKA